MHINPATRPAVYIGTGAFCGGTFAVVINNETGRRVFKAVRELQSQTTNVVFSTVPTTPKLSPYVVLRRHAVQNKCDVAYKSTSNDKLLVGLQCIYV